MAMCSSLMGMTKACMAPTVNDVPVESHNWATHGLAKRLEQKWIWAHAHTHTRTDAHTHTRTHTHTGHDTAETAMMDG